MAKSNLSSLGFVPSKDRELVHPRVIMSVSGLEKQGKTHFALTAPGPIAYVSTDIGHEGVVHKFRDKDIQILDVERVEDDDDTAAEKEWDKFRKGYVGAMRDKAIRSIVVDTATEIWEVLRLARFGRLTQVMPYQYGPVNKEYRKLIRMAYDCDKNLILLHKMKAQYINDKRTGEYERAGFGDTGFLVQVNAVVWRYSADDGGEFAITIRDCRQNPDLMGMEFEGDMCNFETISQLVLA